MKWYVVLEEIGKSNVSHIFPILYDEVNDYFTIIFLGKDKKKYPMYISVSDDIKFEGRTWVIIEAIKEENYNDKIKEYESNKKSVIIHDENVIDLL